MKSLKNYSVPFTGLKLGKHLFEFDIDDAFFDEFEYSLVKKANLKCLVELEKQETMLVLSFHIKGTIDANCDRCLSPYPLQMEIKEQQVAKFSEEEADPDEELIILTKNDHDINIAGLVYEYINVAMPFITVCDNVGNTPWCDKEMLDSLNKLTADTEQKEKTDPRWDVLKKLNEN